MCTGENDFSNLKVNTKYQVYGSKYIVVENTGYIQLFDCSILDYELLISKKKFYSINPHTAVTNTLQTIQY